MRSSAGALLAVLTAAAPLAGCGDDPVLVTPASFERAGDVDFACFELVGGLHAVVPLSRCARPADGGDLDPSLSLTALVTQTSRGEVAAVDLTDNLVLDSDVRVPGFTFVRVGEVPSAIVVPAVDPQITYVASFGASVVQAIPTSRFRPDATGEVSAPEPVALPGGPVALALSPDESRLYAAVPEAGAVYEMVIRGGTLGEPREIPLPPDLVDPATATGAFEGDRRVCPAAVTLQDPLDPGPRDPTALGEASWPVAFAVDEERDWLFVADERRPIVHVIDLSAEPAAPIAQIAVGVPTRALALTPSVPAGLVGDASLGARFLYAIDALDQSVLVVDATDGDGFGAVLPVNVRPGAAADRLDLDPGARTLEIVTPGFPGDACDTSDADALDEIGPGRMRGVFLVAGLQDGTVRFVDVHDLDAGCRGGASCEATDLESEVYIRRHRPRIGALIVDGIRLSAAPTFTFAGRSERILSDGQSDGELAPGLAPLGGCPQEMLQVFPDAEEGGPLVCSIADPWAASEERWTMTWEGAIPRASGGVGRFDREVPSRFVARGARFCARGVSGGDEEQLVILSDVPPSAPDGCALDLGADASGLRPTIAFSVAEAHQPPDSQDHFLVLGAPLGAYTLERVRQCFPELIEYEIRSRGAYTVAGSVAGYLHEVEADEAGRCFLPDGAPRAGRAFPGEPFDNGLVRFQIEPFDATPSPEDVTALEMVVTGVPLSIAVDAGALPQSLRFNPPDQMLYAIDSSDDGLVQIQLDPLDRLRNFE